jgi:hypothetical protein
LTICRLPDDGNKGFAQRHQGKMSRFASPAYMLTPIN